MAGPPPVPPSARKSPRYAVRIGVEVRHGPRTIGGTLLDVSAGGLGLHLPSPVPEDAPVAVSFFLVIDEVEEEGGIPLSLGGTVTWCAEADEGGHRCGIRLGELAPSLQQHFDALLRRAAHPPDAT